MAARTLLDRLGNEPEFNILAAAPDPGEENVFGVPVLQPMGAFAVRPAAGDEWAEVTRWDDGEDDASRPIVRTLHVVESGSPAV
jgi:hypothetical protein